AAPSLQNWLDPKQTHNCLLDAPHEGMPPYNLKSSFHSSLLPCDFFLLPCSSPHLPLPPSPVTIFIPLILSSESFPSFFSSFFRRRHGSESRYQWVRTYRAQRVARFSQRSQSGVRGSQRPYRSQDPSSSS